VIRPLGRDAAAPAAPATPADNDRLGGTAGNELLTSATGALLTVLLIAEAATIVWLGNLRTEHMFVGMALIPPVVLKLASTGYRFVRYYAGTRSYREKGPPLLALRLLAPVLVATTLLVLATGVWLLVIGHRSDLVLQLHKIGFIVWGVCFGVHVLWYLPRAWTSMRAHRTAARAERAPASGLRGALLGASVGGGLALALALLSAIQAWHGRGGG
jgi:hypothetical protein